MCRAEILEPLRTLMGAVELIFDLPWRGESVKVYMKQFVTPRQGWTRA